MTIDQRTFSVASDETLIELIMSARNKLAVIAPALSKPVAEALSVRLRDLDKLSPIVILDADPEVYRMGYGEVEALEIIRSVSKENHFDLREQQGVRIGLVISDDTTVVYSPVARRIEAGSTTEEKPNAVILSGAATQKLAEAAGADANGRNAEIGQQALTPERVEVMNNDLEKNPPHSFDITQMLNIYSSRVHYVEFEVSNYIISKRQVDLPADFVGVGDKYLKKQIKGKISSPLSDIGKQDITIEVDGVEEELEVDSGYLRDERKAIEDQYTYEIHNYGRVLLKQDREKFEKSVDRFKVIIEAYHKEIKQNIENQRETFQDKLIQEFLPRWTKNPPEWFKRWDKEPDEDEVRSRIVSLANDIFDKGKKIDPPKIRRIYKDITYENLSDPEFRSDLESIMRKKHVPDDILDSLFREFDAVEGKE